MVQNKLYELEASPKEKVLECIQKRYPNIKVHMTSQGVSAPLIKNEIPLVVKDMVAAGIQIYGIKEITKTLEERFLEVTETKEEEIHV